MKAIQYLAYGGPENLSLCEVDPPTIKDDQVLIHVRAASINPYDWHHLRGLLPIRLSRGNLFKPGDISILGADMAGMIEAKGSSVTDFEVGDEVFGDVGYGAFGEYVATKTTGLTHKPKNLSFEEAASLPMVTLTAMQALREGLIAKGEKVLINGASGGIGTIAIQLAKNHETEVTAVCSGRNLELVRSLGADHVIDYTTTNFKKHNETYDLILDCVGNFSVNTLRRHLNPEGRAIVVGFSGFGKIFETMIYGGFISKTTDKYIGLCQAEALQADMKQICEWAESEQIKPVIDRSYDLVETPEAMRYVATRRARGKVIIRHNVDVESSDSRRLEV